MTRNLLNLLKSAIALSKASISSEPHELSISVSQRLQSTYRHSKDWVGFRSSTATVKESASIMQEEPSSKKHLSLCFTFDRAVQAACAATHNSEAALNMGGRPMPTPFLISTLLSIRLRFFHF